MQTLHLLLILVLQLVKPSSSQKPPKPQYHMGPVLSQPINLYIIWYGKWETKNQPIIRDFITSLSSPTSSSKHPSVRDWWHTVTLYTDQTNSRITDTINLSNEFNDPTYSQGKSLTRLSMQHVIKNAVTPPNRGALPLDYTNGLYLVLTSRDVMVQDFCGGSVCGFHYFTFPSIVGATVPYAWVGDSGTQCPGMCAYPFAWDKNLGPKPPPGFVYGPPNGDVGIDGMISVIAHELAEAASDPLVNAWYADGDPTAPVEIGDLCRTIYGTGGGSGGYVGAVYNDSKGNGYNLLGVNKRRFLVQWMWDPVRQRCYGPNEIRKP